MTTDFLEKTIRHLPAAALPAMDIAAVSPNRPSLYSERNGNGYEYCKLRYSMPAGTDAPPVQRSVHLGRMSAADMEALQLQIDYIWLHNPINEPLKSTRARLKFHSDNLNATMEDARSYALAAGYTMTGYSLGNPDATAPLGPDATECVRQLYMNLQRAGLELAGMRAATIVLLCRLLRKPRHSPSDGKASYSVERYAKSLAAQAVTCAKLSDSARHVAAMLRSKDYDV